MMLRIVLTIFIILMLVGTLRAQNTSSAGAAMKIEDLPEGISHSSVNCILQDQKGFIWIGTQDGLNRFDGYQFKIYKHDPINAGSISNSTIQSIFEDDQGNLWVGPYRGGLNLFEKTSDNFTQFDYEIDKGVFLSKSVIYDIIEDETNVLWLGTSNGLIRFDKEKKAFLPSPIDEYNKGPNAHVWVLYQDSKKFIWIGTDGLGLWRFDPNTKKHEVFVHDSKDETTLSSNGIRSIYEDRHGNLWIGTEGAGLNLFNEESKKFSILRNIPNDLSSLGDDDVMAISEDSNGNLIIGTDGGGINILAPENNEFIHLIPKELNPKSINDNVVGTLYRDKQGNLWIGTFRGGTKVAYNYEDKFMRYEKGGGIGLSHNSVLSITGSNQEGLWIGTDGGGLNYLDLGRNIFLKDKLPIRIQKSPGDDVVLSILEDSKGNLWVGTFQGGLKFFKNDSKEMIRFKHDVTDEGSLLNNSVWVIFEDSNEDLWFGTNGGLNLFDKDTKKFIRFQSEVYKSRIRNEYSIRAIYEDDNQNLWISVMGGIKRIDLKTKSTSTYNFIDYPENDLDNYWINTIYKDSQGNLWLGTYGGGLILFDEEKGPIRDFRIQDGLPNNIIYGILEDDDGNLWISTNNGLSKFNFNLLAFKNYNLDDGLQGSQFNLGAYHKDDKGRLWFGGISGLNVFYPDSIFDNEFIPPVIFTDFKIFNRSVSPLDRDSPLKSHISEVKEIRLTHKQSVFSFEFAGLNYIHPEINNYAFQLQGFEEQWNYVGNQRTATYTNLDAGEYVFKVKSSNNDGLWNEKGSSIKLIITPPWWKTWWAYILYFILIAGLLLWWRHDFITRQRLLTKMKFEHLELANMKEMDHLKSRFFANISHELRTPLTLLLDPLRSMYYKDFKVQSKKQVKTMFRNAQRLLNLINQLLDLSKLDADNMKLEASRGDIVIFFRQIVASFNSYAEERQIAIQHSFPNEPVFIYFDRDKLEKIVTNLISNAIKFTPPNGKIEVMIKVVSLDNNNSSQFDHLSEYLEITIRDNGFGIPENRIKFIFDRFYQVDGAHPLKQEGVGIGLSLTKELVDLHKGNIMVESREGIGSTFKVLLQLGKDHLKESEIMDSVETKPDDEVEIISELNEMDTKYSLVRNDGALLQDAKDRLLIIVVEDDTDLRTYIREHLEQNYKVLEAANGREGLKMCVDVIPDLIISDVMMPEMDGVEMCNKIKTDKRTSHIPVILLTARTDSENKIIGLETGADDYETKPFDSRILEIKVRNLIRSREILRERFSNNRRLVLEPKEITITPIDEIFLKNLLESIENNMSNSEFTVLDLGKDVGISRMQLYRKLKALTGLSPNGFIRTIRLKRAAQLIDQKQLTIAEVTYDVGFNNLQYFRDCFKKYFGINPSDYANRDESLT